MRENSKLDFKSEMNLQRLCMMKIATSLWEQENTKQKIRIFFTNFFPNDDDYLFFKNWDHHLTDDLLIFLKNLPLPSNLIFSLKNLINITGLQICNWTKFVSKILELEINYAEEVFWTNYGTIDRIRIFKNWVDNKKLETCQLFNVACIFCMEKYIPILWNKIPNDVKNNNFYSEKIYKNSIYNIIAYWKNFLEEEMNRRFRIGYENENFPDEIFSWFNICNNSQSIEENLFRISVLDCLEMGVEYFWNTLNDEERERSVRILMKTFYPKRDETEYARILFFLTTELSGIRSSEYHFFILYLSQFHNLSIDL